MIEAKKCKVEVKKDHLSKIAAASPETALSELIWNSLDADANNVEVKFNEGPLGVNEIWVQDDGTGIVYGDAEGLFNSLGGSWKKNQQKTRAGRFLHGQNGEGRFKSFTLGDVVGWDVIYKKGNAYMQYSIEERADSLDTFSLTDEKEIAAHHAGVKVRITELTKKIHVFNKEKAIEKLTPIFAPYLSNYSDIQLNIGGTRIDPNEVICSKVNLPIHSITVDGIEYSIDFEIIEWNGIKEQELWFCAERGFPLELCPKKFRGIGEFGYSGYLKSSYFQILQNEGSLILSNMSKTVTQIFEEAVNKIKDHFFRRTLELGRDQLEKWKEEKVYPYTSEPQSPVDVAERQVFDIIAINVNQSLPDFDKTEKRTKAFQLRMLRQAIERSPEELQLIVNEVLQLPKKKREQLAELLKDTTLSGIISASSLVTERLKFISGLEYMLFDVDIKKHLKERSQLHRILAENTWVFGHEYGLSVDDKSLTEVLRKHDKDMIIESPVKRLDGSTGIVDLMLSRAVPRNHANEREHLVVELKAPSVKIGQKEITQIKSYAFAVAKDERFRGLKTRWHFWVISNEMDDYAEMELSQEKYEEGVIYKTSKDRDYTIWIKTWSQLIQENKHRLQFLREKLDLNIAGEDAFTYLKKTYAEYTRGL